MVLLPETIPFLAELMEGKSRKLAKDFCWRKLYALTENAILFFTFQMSALMSRSSVNTLFRRLNKFWESLYKNIFDKTLSLAV